MRTDCAWCDARLHGDGVEISHGICPRCAVQIEAEAGAKLSRESVRSFLAMLAPIGESDPEAIGRLRAIAEAALVQLGRLGHSRDAWALLEAAAEADHERAR